MYIGDFEYVNPHSLTKEDAERLIEENLQKIKEIYVKYFPENVDNFSNMSLQDVLYQLKQRIVPGAFLFSNENYAYSNLTLYELNILNLTKYIEHGCDTNYGIEKRVLKN